MARSCGLRIGPRRFELVVLDGSAKKHKITAYMAGELPRDGDDPIATAAAAVLREAVKQHNVPHDNVGVAIDTGLAAFRTHQGAVLGQGARSRRSSSSRSRASCRSGTSTTWSSTSTILESTDDASELLVTAVPKADLKTVIDDLREGRASSRSRSSSRRPRWSTRR